ncbi:MAG: 50S ribosomal protein L17 [Nitrospirota bacterium]|nr:MAG: 50S ribosomal protein L17 [Nitrospirota bacterium]
MRHRRSNKTFNRTANQRKALFRSLMASVIEHERIETTVVKAREIKRLTEKMVTLGKKGDLNSRRIAFSRVPVKKVIKKLFDEIAPRFADRNGGYMRIIKTRNRIKDNAPLAVLEFVDYEEKNLPELGDKAIKKEQPKKAAPKKAAAKKTAPPKEVKEEEKEPAKKKAKKKAAAKKKTTEKKAAKKTTEKKEAAAKKKAKKKTTSKKKTTAKKKTTKKK